MLRRTGVLASRVTGPSGVEGAAADSEAEDDGLKPLSERLIMELTAHRTLALRDALANDPEMAFLSVVHGLALQTFYPYATESCLEITVKSTATVQDGSEDMPCGDGD